MSDMMRGVTLGLWVVGFVCLGLLVYYAAQCKIFFTAPKEGTAEFFMTGKTVKRMIMLWKGRHVQGLAADRPVDDSRFDIVDGDPVYDFSHYFNPLNWMEIFGIYWIGIWPFYEIYQYDFVWTEEKLDENGKIVPYTRRATKKSGEGQTSYVRVNDTNYFFVSDDVKTKGGVPTKFILLVTVRIENPYKALFRGEDWLERTGGAIHDMVIRYAGVLEYEQITASDPALVSIFKNGKAAPAELYHLEELIKSLGNGQDDDNQGTDLLRNYGVRIVAAKRHSFDFADSEVAKQLRVATTQRYVADQKGKGEAAEAEGKAAAVVTLANAEKYRIETTYSPIAGDDKGERMKIRQLEAMEKSGDKGGNTIVVPDELLGLARKFSQK
jgi:regulator of protease activity HflC (stomatin/prohibitin superfamily)